MSHVVEEMPPTKRPDDPFVREMGDALWRIESNYYREGTGAGSRFAGQLLSDAQAEHVVRKTRERDAPAPRYELRPDGYLHRLTLKTSLQDRPIEALAYGYDVVEVANPSEVRVNFVATPDQARAMLALLNRREPLQAVPESSSGR